MDPLVDLYFKEGKGVEECKIKIQQKEVTVINCVLGLICPHCRFHFSH